MRGLVCDPAGLRGPQGRAAYDDEGRPREGHPDSTMGSVEAAQGCNY